MNGTRQKYTRPDRMGRPNLARWNALQARYQRRFRRGWMGRLKTARHKVIDFCGHRSELALRLIVWITVRRLQRERKVRHTLKW